MNASSVLLFLIIIPARSFSIISGVDVKSIIRNSADATTVPSDLIDKIKFEVFARSETSCEYDQCISCTVSISSDFYPLNETQLEPDEYKKYISNRHSECVNLFDRYESKVLRCEQLGNKVTSNIQIEEFNIRWRASWISAGSVWLYDLADAVGWKIEKKVPDYSEMSVFSWRNVIQVFIQAFQSGTIKLPIFEVEGNSRLKIQKNDDASSVAITVKESIDLVIEADLGRLQNRRVAQELACWLDVSRRPTHMDGDEAEWAATVQERILKNVPFSGPLDVDPNEDDPGTALAFGLLCVSAFWFLYSFLLGEVVGGTGEVSKLCDDAEILEMGSGYFSECFGPYGDGPFS